MTGFIVPCNIKYAPYVQYYIDIYKKSGAEFEIISWDKRGESEPCDHVYHKCVRDSERFKVMLGYLGFSNFVKRIVKKKKYDNLIVFTVAPAIFLSGMLKKYTGKYILDVRDASPLVAKLPKRFASARAGAKCVVSSSPSFNEWIGGEPLICHNVSVETMIAERDADVTVSLDKKPCGIVFAGFMNEGEINLSLEKQLAGDGDFELHFFGPSSDKRKEMEDYKAECGAENVHFYGTYNKGEIVDIYRKHGDLANIIRRKCRVNRDALPNKLYDAVSSGKPIIVFSHNEAICHYAKKFDLGIILEDGDEADFKTALKNGIEKLDIDAYKKGRIKFIDEVVSDQERFRAAVLDFMGGEQK